MPTLNYFVVALGTSIDVQTNALTVFKVAEVLSPKELPRKLPFLYPVCSWLATEPTDPQGNFQSIIRVHLPGEPVPVDSEAINFEFKEHERARLRFFIDSLEVKKAGVIRFELLLNAKHIADYFLTITEPE
jgi:hypothetical protein